MSVITTALRHLINAGVTGDALVSAISEIEAEFLSHLPRPDQAKTVDDAAEKRRAYDRERKRAKKAAQSGSTGIPPEKSGIPQSDGNSTGNDEAAPTLSLPPNENNSNPPTHTHPDITPPAREAIPFDAHVTARNEALAAGWKPKRKRKSPAAGLLARPTDVSDQVWADFLKHRKTVGGDVSETVIAGFRREADRVGWPLQRAMEESILRGWRGFRAKWVNDDERGTADRGAPAGHRPAVRVDGITAAINEGLANAQPRQPSGPTGRFGFADGEGDRELVPARARVLR